MQALIDRTLRVSFLIMLILSFTAIVAYGQEKKKKYTPDDLPKEVINAFHKDYPKASIKGVGVEKEHGVLLYEIESYDGSVKRDLLYSPAGKKIESEETIPMSAVPANVKLSLSREYPQGKVQKSELVNRDSSVTYEFLVKDGSKTHEVVISPDGKIVKGGKNTQDKDEDEDEDDDDDVEG